MLLKPCSTSLTSHPVETHSEGIVLSKQLQVGQRAEKWPTTTFICVAVAWSFALLAGLLQQCIILCFYFHFLEGFGGHIHNIMTKSMSLFICIWQETKNKKVIFRILVMQVLQRPSLYFPYSLTMDDTKQSTPLCKKREASIHIH